MPVVLSRSAYVATWWAIVSLHAVSCAYFTLAAFLYCRLPGSSVSYSFDLYSITSTFHGFTAAGVAHAVAAGPHGLAILWMVGTSLYRRQLVTALAQGAPPTSQKKINEMADTTEAKVPPSTGSRVASFLYRQVMEPTGWFGIDSPYFHQITFLRELSETAFQSYQAYRMSVYLPRIWLNNAYVALIVLNCWLVPLINLSVRRNDAQKRLLVLTCDALLDCIASVGIPTTLCVYYAQFYSPDLMDFPSGLWYDELWNMYIYNESQIILVSSWLDLVGRVLFAYGAFSALDSIKDLVARTPSRPSAIAAAPTVDHGPTSLQLKADKVQAAATTAVAVAPATDGAAASVSLLKTPQQRRRALWLHRVMHVTFFVWGCLVGGAHLEASTRDAADMTDCLLGLRPWFGQGGASCSLMRIDCYRRGITGASNEIDAIWARYDQRVLSWMILRHCPALELPPSFQRFRDLRYLKMYNCSIAAWSEKDAALRRQHHTTFTTLVLVRVTLPGDGELPAALTTADFPKETFHDFMICVTNLAALPDHLDQVWPLHIWTLYIENARFRAIPDVVLRLAPWSVSFAGNPLTELPPSLFSMPAMQMLDIGGTQVTRLPHNVTYFSERTTFFLMPHTNVTFFWSWTDPWIELLWDIPFYTLYAGNSPYCSELAQLEDGNRTDFSFHEANELARVQGDASYVPPEAQSRLMNASDLDYILHVVNCDDFAVEAIPLARDDANNALD